MYIEKRLGVLSLLRRTWKLQLMVFVTVTVSTGIYLEYLQGYFKVSGIVVTVLGTAISFFIGFINSHAYGRWWEARKIWGALVNDSRSFGRMVVSFVATPPEGSETEVLALRRELVRRHIAFLYALKERLRNESSGEYEAFLSDHDRQGIDSRSHKPNAILDAQGKDIDSAQRSGYLEIFRMTQINAMLTRFTDSMGQAERIKTTVFPVFYATLIRRATWYFLALCPMAISDVMGYWAILFGFVLGSIFMLTYNVGQMLLDPFENLPMDTAMSTITRNIEINLLEQLGDEDVPEPLPPVNNQYAM